MYLSIFKGGSRRGLKSGIKIIDDKKSKNKRKVLLNENPKLFKRLSKMKRYFAQFPLF
jgi:hypothetical protein